MSILKKVILEFDDKILTVEGEEVEKWQEYNKAVAILAQNHGMNPFDYDPIKWVEKAAAK